MRIASVRVTAVHVPRTRPFGRTYVSGTGASEYSEHGIVEVETDTGLTGLGEIATVFSPPGRALCRQAEEALAPALIGVDPLDTRRALRDMHAAGPVSRLAVAGAEMALWDLAGQALGTPVYNLLGGRCRERVPLGFSIPYGEPQEMAAYAARLHRAGFRTVKVKVGRDDERDLAAVAAVRAAVGPRARVRVDANACWEQVDRAVAMIGRLARFGIELIEQPAPGDDLGALAAIRAAVDVPVMADESVWGPHDAIEVVRAGAADVLNVYVTEAGGLRDAAAIFAIGEHAGLRCMIGSMPELGIGTAAQIHLGVSVANLDLDSDACGSLYHEHDLLAEPLRIEDGYAYPPPGPGLGVRLDREAFEAAARRAREHHETTGEEA